MNQGEFSGLPPAEEVPQKSYKLKHKPSGLFYRPTNGFMGIVQGNPSLSKRGKTYYSRGHLTGLTQYRDLEGEMRFINWSEWEIIEQLAPGESQSNKES